MGRIKIKNDVTAKKDFTNKTFVDLFNQLSELMGLKGDNIFRVLAYEKAARSISEMSESIFKVYSRSGKKGLKEINSIGEGVAEKIEEYIETSKIKELDELRKQFPKAEVEFLKIPGVGPSTARILFKNFKSKTIDELKIELKKRGELFFKERSLKKILNGIEILKNLGDRMLLKEAEEMALPVENYLKGCKLSNIKVVGSLRRKKETVGDIDFVATSSNPRESIEEISKFRALSKIIGRGETKISAILNSGKEIDIEILPEEKYGSLLLHFTGSKEHNVALRTLAQEKGLSLSEHGIKDEKNNKLINFKTEEEVYNKLGLNYIEPELRENRGEIEASLNSRLGKTESLPKLINEEDIKGDLHVHSNWSDGFNDIEEVVLSAQEINYQYIAIADHTVTLGIARGLDQNKFLQRRQEIKRIQKKFKNLKILDSCEVNIMPDGSLDLPEKLLKNFDIVNASVHSKFNQSKAEMTKRIITAIKNQNVDIIGHPTGRILNKRPEYEADWVSIYKAAAENKTALEISAYPNRLDLNDSYIFEARKYGVMFAISTDAHALSELLFMKYGVYQARRGWAESKSILNTLNVSDLLAWLKSK